MMGLRSNKAYFSNINFTDPNWPWSVFYDLIQLTKGPTITQKDEVQYVILTSSENSIQVVYQLWVSSTRHENKQIIMLLLTSMVTIIKTNKTHKVNK